MPAELLTLIVGGIVGALGVGGKLVLNAILAERREFIDTLRQIVVDERTERLSLRAASEAERDRWMAELGAHTAESKGLYHMLSMDRERAHESRDAVRDALTELVKVVRAMNGKE